MLMKPTTPHISLKPLITLMYGCKGYNNDQQLHHQCHLMTLGVKLKYVY